MRNGDPNDPRSETPAAMTTDDRGTDMLGWWREARFGLFIHWGLYAIPAGVWKGEEIPGIGEQIMRFAEIPASEYAELAGQFNPHRFDAEQWVAIAKSAGMKYLVITAKHHDGFALFKSAHPFNAVDATPFGRDIIAELAAACDKGGIRFCVYYSQRQDWSHPDGTWNEWPDQFPVPVEKRGYDFSRCMNEKSIPQVKELLTQYGPIGLVWFDTPHDSTPEQSRTFRDLVHDLQPECLVCSRVGNGYGDYTSLDDNGSLYCGSRNLDGEIPATMNHTWGYKSTDHDWMNVEDALHSLIHSVANGCNYLLNVGPKGDGQIPEESVERLKAMGEWMHVNGEAVYGAGMAPFPNPFSHGVITAKGDSLYLICSEWPGSEVVLRGLKTKVLNAVLLADPNRSIECHQERHSDGLVVHGLRISNLPPAPPEGRFPVIKLELAGKPEAEQVTAASGDGTIHLFAGCADIERSEGSKLTVDEASGVPEAFHENSGSLSWTFAVERPGTYCLEALTNRRRAHPWIAGVLVEIETDAGVLKAELKPDRALDNLQKHYHPETISEIGDIEFSAAGMHRLCLRVADMPKDKETLACFWGKEEKRTVKLVELRLLPQH